MIRTFGSQRGAALIIVIWVVAFFSIVLAAFAFSMRTELDAARNFKEEAEAAEVARAGIEKAMVTLVNTGPNEISGSMPPGPLEAPLGRGAYRVVIGDEEGKISLNRAPAEVLARLLQNTGVGDQHLVDTIVDSIQDWRDTDKFHRLNGAEDEYYQSLPQPYHAKDGDFDTVEELLLVKGMTPQILYGNIKDRERLALLGQRNPGERHLGPGEYLGIRPFLTVYGSGQANPNTASFEVLMALGPPDAARIIVDGRGQNQTGARQARVRPGSLLTAVLRTYSLESFGRLNDSSTTYRIAAVVVNEGTRERPRLRVLAWWEGR